MKIIKYLICVLSTFTVLLISGLDVEAQQTIINVPSSEVLPVGEIILKDSNRFRPFSPDEFVSITPSVTAGVGHGIEASGGVATSINDGVRVRGDVSVKKVTFITGSTRFTVGMRVSPYLSESSGPDNFTYAHISQRIRKTKTSLTAGMYVAGNKQFLPDRPGVVLGLDQVLIGNKLRLVVDWISRNESYGVLGAGLKYRPTRTISITGAALIPNGDESNLAFLVSISKYVSLKR